MFRISTQTTTAAGSPSSARGSRPRAAAGSARRFVTGALIAGCLLAITSTVAVPESRAQVYPPLTKRTHISVGSGLGSYAGDFQPDILATSGLANAASIYYQVRPRLGFGIAVVGNSKLVVVDTLDTDNRDPLTIVRAGLRSYLVEGPAAPFVDLNGVIAAGGSSTGFGLGVAFGYRLGIGSAFAISPVIRLDSVLPDDAADGASENLPFDLIVGGGIELTLSLPFENRPLRFADVSAPDTLLVGQTMNAWARVSGRRRAANATYGWWMGDGTQLAGSDVSHAYPAPGFYEGTVEAVSGSRRVTETFGVYVHALVETEAEIGQRLEQEFGVRIDSLYGSRVTEVGREENYRARLSPGQAWPVQYWWDMGDGVRALGNNIVHRYREPGYYTVRVTARNQYGADSTYAVVRVVPEGEGRLIAPEPAPADPAVGNTDRRPIDDGGQPARDVELAEGEFYAWSIETHFVESVAQAAVREYRAAGLSSARLYADRSGGGSVAYRVVVGRYTTSRTALREKTAIEDMSGRTISLITVR